jgi:isoquinoline 1-oxidoreductase subunit beta
MSKTQSIPANAGTGDNGRGDNGTGDNGTGVKANGMSRRAVIATGAGLTFGFAVPFGLSKAAAQKLLATGTEVNAWIVIKPDETVLIRIARSEMGQGSMTGLAQLVAEELDCDWAKVKTEFPRPDQNLARNRVWGDMSTGGSRGIRASQDYVRKAGATARMMLVQAAANDWKVSAAECKAANGVVLHLGTGRKASYGKLAAAAALLPPPKEVPLKDPKNWTIAGKPLKRLDTADKLNGRLVYGADLKLPGMLNAAIKDSPVFGNKIVSFDATKVSTMAGVKHVIKVNDTAVAVVADTWWHAKKALDALPVTYETTENNKVSSAAIAEILKDGLTSTTGIMSGQKVGDADAAIAGAVKKVEAVYTSPFLNHACMEPMNCTAKYTASKLEVWVPTQNADASLAAASEASGLKAEQCEVHKMLLGGGFGRRGMQDYVRQAVSIAKQIPGVPVKLLWSREEDMLHGFYRPITQARLEGGLDDKGNLVGLKFRISGQSILAFVAPSRMENGVDKLQFQGLLPDEYGYTIPNLTIDHAMRNTHVPVGFWRGVNHNQNAIYSECFMDELAHAAGRDPLEFRRALLKGHPKHLAVLNAAAEKADWGKPLPAGQFRGICQNMGFGSYGAAVAEVSVSPKGKVKIHRIVAAIDCGIAVNPDQIAAQIEGSFAYGLSALLYNENTLKDGRMVEENFDNWQVMRMDEMPKVESVILQSGGFWGGVGEPTIAVAAPAVLNAIFAATGKRVRNLPLKNEKIV